MSEQRLQGCPRGQRIQRELAQAKFELIGAQSALDVAHIAPGTPKGYRKAIEARVSETKEKESQVNKVLLDHIRECPACANVLKPA
jgi:hypothetical protein